MCAKKHAHLDYKTADAGYPLRHKQYFDLKYILSGVADPWSHKKYIDLEERASDATNQTYYHCKSLIQTYNISKHILPQSPEKIRKILTFIINFEHILHRFENQSQLEKHFSYTFL